MFRCNKCGGRYYGSEAECTGDYYCNCVVTIKVTPNSLPTGWICPRCGKVHSPFSLTCDCYPYEYYGGTTLLSDSLIADYRDDIIWDKIL